MLKVALELCPCPRFATSTSERAKVDDVRGGMTMCGRSAAVERRASVSSSSCPCTVVVERLLSETLAWIAPNRESWAGLGVASISIPLLGCGVASASVMGGMTQVIWVTDGLLPFVERGGVGGREVCSAGGLSMGLMRLSALVSAKGLVKRSRDVVRQSVDRPPGTTPSARSSLFVRVLLTGVPDDVVSLLRAGEVTPLAAISEPRSATSGGCCTGLSVLVSPACTSGSPLLGRGGEA